MAWRNPNRLIEPRVDETTGALQYSYPIAIPPGRNGLQPDLKLDYNSQRNDQNGAFGYGWSLNIPTISRLNRYGVEKLYTNPVFASDYDGELVQTATGTYIAKVEQGDFRSYAYSSASNSWIVTDKSGTTYKFGTTAASRQDDATSTNAFRWYVDEVRDTNDNYIKYEYTKSQGQVYPYRITYTGHQTSDGPFTVTFALESRPDVAVTSDTGYKVTTASRVNEIDVNINGTLERKYALAYGSGTNTIRSLLTSVTETGYDESSNAVTLPATQFGYQSVANSPGWTKTTDPSFNISNNGFDWGRVLVDVNGDGLVDEVSGLCVNCSATTSDVYINSGNGAWNQNSSWKVPALIAYYQSSSTPPSDAGTRFVDVNGDGLVDVLVSTLHENTNGTNTYDKYAFLNTGHGWAPSSTWIPSMPFVIWDPNGTEYDNAVRFADLNGDGLIDISVSHVGYDPVDDSGNYYNNGAGWTKSGTPPFQYSDGKYDQGTRLVDVNGDGLADIITGCATTGHTGTSNVYLNNGANGWRQDATWTLPLLTCTNKNVVDLSQDAGTRFMDVNNDGLIDAVQYYLSDDGHTPPTYTQVKDAYINTGKGWKEQSSWSPPAPFLYEDQYVGGATDYDMGTRIADFDGDGKDDILKDSQTATGYPYTDQGIYHANSYPELLTSATSTSGGVYKWSYKATPNYLISTLLNPNLPSPIQTVATSTKDNGFGTVETNVYSYQGGKYWFNTPYDKKFAGFQKIKVTDGFGQSITTYYHQGDASATGTGEYYDSYYKIGKSYRQETRDAVGNLQRVVIDKWDQSDLGNGSAYVKLARETTEDYDGNSSHRDKSTEYAYDTHGNLTTQTDWGEVNANDDGTFTDTGSDKLVTTNSYVSSGPAGLQTRALVTDQGSNTVRDTKYYYDNQSYGTATLGNRTKTENWLTGSTYINSQKAYNGYGLVTQETDPRGKQTAYSYDSYELYPATITNPLSQQTQYLYDYSSGKPKQVTDPNLLVTQTIFDGLDRVTSEKQPDQSSSSTLVAKTDYAYTDAALATNVKRTDWLDGTTGVDAWTYYDGFDRPIQTRKRAEASNTYATSDTAYDVHGLVSKVSLPYFSTGTSRTSATTDGTLYTTTLYDPMLRAATSTNALGTTSMTHDDWKTTVVDPLGHKRVLYDDAYGRLVQVDEIASSTNTYTTAYQYDGNGNLTKLTDALANVRNFTYDGIGRRLTAEDLHAVGDGTFGTWNYTYDDAGNLTSVVDPKGQTINTVFDDINRPTSEDYTGQAGTEAVFAYDACQYGIGHLCSESDASATTTRAYGPTGLVASETKTIGGTGYTTATTYDRQGNVLTLTQPDSSQVQDVYNAGGLLEKLQRKESGDPSWTDVVSNFDWSPVEKPTTISFANSATTTNTYDATKLYRMTARQTTVPDGSGLRAVQALAYTYDADNDVTRIVDSGSGTPRTTDYGYDALNRLTSASTTAPVGGGMLTYSYDAIGDLTGRTDLGALTYSGTGYANPNAVTYAGGNAYGYDDDGNLTSRGSDAFTWDYKNRLLSSTVGGTATIYGYGPEGDRVLMTTGATSTAYASDWYSTTGGTPTKHLFAMGELVATLVGSGSSTAVHYVHTDHLTGASAVTSATGALEESLDYNPYGDSRVDDQPAGYSEVRKYAGHEWDAADGLSYMGARYYDPSTGRFLSEDAVDLNLGDTARLGDILDQMSKSHDESFVQTPGNRSDERQRRMQLEELLSDPQKLNSYSYVQNNPIRNIDPTGNQAELAIPIIDYGPQILAGTVAISAAIGSYVLSKEAQVHWDPGRQPVPNVYDGRPNYSSDPKLPDPKGPGPRWLKWVIAAPVVMGEIEHYVQEYKDIKQSAEALNASAPQPGNSCPANPVIRPAAPPKSDSSATR